MADGHRGGSGVPLTERELQIALLIPFMSNEEIGQEVGLSGRTVRMYSDRIKVKLGVSRRSDIVRGLRDLGLL